LARQAEEQHGRNAERLDPIHLALQRASTDRWYTPGIEPISRSMLEPCTTKSG
jgi:hypothetical protein